MDDLFKDDEFVQFVINKYFVDSNMLNDKNG